MNYPTQLFFYPGEFMLSDTGISPENINFSH